MEIIDVKSSIEELISWAEKELDSTLEGSAYAHNLAGMIYAYKEVMELINE